MDDLLIRLKIEGAEQVASGAGKAAEGLSRFGVAGATAGKQVQLSGQQMAQVSAQLQDLFIQIQGGQAPLTALLQQGSQLTTVFGGVGGALRAVGSFALTLVNPVTLAAAAVAAFGLAYYRGTRDAEAFSRSLILSGNAAGTTVGQLQALAQAQSEVAGTQGAAADALARLAATGQVSAVSLGSAAEAAVRFARVGGDIDDTVKKFSALGKEPLKALIDLNAAENFLTESTYRQVKSLEARGRATEAAAVAQSAYAEVVIGRSKALEENLGTLERAWKGVGDIAKQAWDKMLNVGRPDTMQDQLKDVLAQIQAAQAKIANVQTEAFKAANPYLNIDRIVAAQQRLVEQLKVKADAIGENIRLENRSAQQQAAQVTSVKALIKADEDAAKAVKSINAEREREAKLIAELNGLSGDFAEQWKGLTALYKTGKLSLDQLTQAQSQLLEKQPAIRAEREREQALLKALQEQYQATTDEISAFEVAQSKARESGRLAVDAYVRSIEEQNAQTTLELSLVGRTQQARELALAQYRIELDLKKQIDAIDRNSGFDEAQRIEERARARAAATKALAGAETKAVVDEWQRAAARIDDSLTDALLRGFESGKDFAGNLRDTVVNMFKTMVLRPVISAVISPLSVGLSSMLGVGAASAATGAAGGAAGAGLLGAIGLGGLSASSIGSAIGAGFMSTIGGGTIAGGKAAGLLAGGAGTGTGFAGMVGAALPWVGGAALLGNALGLFRTTAYKGTSLRGTLGSGDINDYDVTRKSGTLFSGPSWRENNRGESAVSDSVQAAYEQMRIATAGMAEQLGINGDAIRKYTQSLYIDGNGKSPEEMQRLLAEAVTSANDSLAKFALGTTAYTKEGESASQTLARLSVGLQGVNYVLDELGQSTLSVSLSGGAMADQLAGLFGGLDSFVQTASSYYQAYYSEAERAAKTTEQVTKGLAQYGLAMPASREAYRSLVEAQDLSTESGRKAYAELLKLAPAFAQVTAETAVLTGAADNSAKAMAEAAARMAEAGRKVLADLADEQGSLQVDLLRAQGNSSAAAVLERQRALARLTGGLSATDAAAATAAYDYNAALQQQIQTLQAASAAAQEAAEAEAQRVATVARQRAGLEQQLLQLQGNTNALRALELAGLDASNQALQQQIYSLQDAAAAQTLATQAAEAEAQRVAAVAQQRAGLEQQLLQLQGNTNALRALELAGLDASNQALQQQIYSLQDAAAAQTLATQAAEA
ncbi:phage tail length tape measure family protein, partial [Paucibacter sp. DJ4R-1]|nr:phage tail length tape measure family protein [Paucibacter sp. DJ4R-1]